MFAFCNASVGQEYLWENTTNPRIKKELHAMPYLKSKVSLHTTTLPFIDDFAELNIFPNPAKWVDKHAYINDDYCIKQPTIGVATLDAIDQHGDLHPFPDTASLMPGDTLTSQLIDLAAFAPVDSVYLSFFVQGGGLGNTPEERDKIILQFRSAEDNDTLWRTVWEKPGEQMERFESVIIPVAEEKFFHDSMQFRFINYFSMEYAGMNCDHWHIDYVMMDKNRSVNDSLIDEVAYIKNVNKLLNTFSSVPWSHFKNYYAQIVDRIVYAFRNYSENIMNVTPYLRWTNLYTQEVNDIGNIAGNYEPNTTFELRKPINNSLFTIDDNDSARFEVQNRFYISDNDYAPNNQTKRIIDFYNYYAYDDGSAEGMYGVSNKYGMIAVKFEVYRADSLKAIRIYFNKSQGGKNRYFNIMVWDAGGSGPGEVLYTQTRNLPSYADSINDFVTIELDDAVAVDKSFYIGWQKITDQRLNMGFDKNNVAYQKNYYNSNGQWRLSEYDGSLMIRPVLGEMFAFKDSFIEPDIETPNEAEVRLYPNPVPQGQVLHVVSSEQYFTIDVFNQVGQLEMQMENADQIDLSDLSTGLYIVRIGANGNYSTHKIIKQ
ncbi:MAG: T9SS type A sorting domain-containing protein [Salinivirgaceae bacterium]